jgi:hypothetical protein
MKMLKCKRKIHDNDAKLKKGLNHHGWGLHGGTWNMSRWGRNITPETGSRAGPVSKCTPSNTIKTSHVSMGGRF